MTSTNRTKLNWMYGSWVAGHHIQYAPQINFTMKRKP
jgi:hypothetical protein